MEGLGGGTCREGGYGASFLVEVQNVYYLYNLDSKVVVSMSRDQYCLSSFLKLVLVKYINGL